MTIPRNLLPLALAALLSLPGCCSAWDHGIATVGEPLGCQHPVLKGRFTDDRYFDSTGGFSLEVPRECHRVVDELSIPEQQMSCAIFDNGMGRLVRLEVYTLPDDVYQGLILDHRFDSVLLKDIFANAALAPIQQAFPGTVAANERLLDVDGDFPSLFATIHIPGGSTLADSVTRQPLDSFRGYLLFIDGNQLVVMSCQLSPLAKASDDVAAVFQELQAMRAGYRNETL